MIQQFLQDSELVAKIAGILRALTTIAFLYVLCKQVKQLRVRRLMTFKIALIVIVLASIVFSIPSWILTYNRAEGLPISKQLANTSVISSATSGLLAAAAFLFIYKKPKE